MLLELGNASDNLHIVVLDEIKVAQVEMLRDTIYNCPSHVQGGATSTETLWTWICFVEF